MKFSTSTLAAMTFSLSSFAAAELSFGTKNIVLETNDNDSNSNSNNVRSRGLYLFSANEDNLTTNTEALSSLPPPSATRGSSPLTGCWGQFSQDNFCLEKIPGSSTVVFAPCDDTVPTQMWKFDLDAPNPDYIYGGLVYNMDGGCLVFQEGEPNDGIGHDVMVAEECARNDSNQHWLSDGDSLRPRDSRDVCVTPYYLPILDQDPVYVLTCEDTNSLDY